MSRFRRALAGAAMAVAMAGSGIVAVMAGAAPAHAATTPTPAAVSHTFGFTIAPAAGRRRHRPQAPVRGRLRPQGAAGAAVTRRPRARPQSPAP